jgi:polyisoprenoid-binding protein YceI
MGTETAHIRIVDGREVPPTGRWNIDPAHSSIGLVARHMMISKVRGRFREFSGFADIADIPERSLVEVTIQAASIDTDDEERDRHLRSPDFLDVDRFPTITYLSTAVRPTAGDRWEMSGDLTVRGVTKPVTMDVEFEGAAVDPWQNLRAGFLATTEINRDEFDMTWNQALETGGFLVGKGIKVEADVELVLQSES